MSGLEVAGLVLGAFPIALGVLGTYKEVARRGKFWYKIAEEHTKCDSQLKFHKIVYVSNLKKLLLPLAGLDDTHVDELIQNPAGKCWTEARAARILEERLGDSYEIYMQCMNEFHGWIEAMNRELALDVATRQPSRGVSPTKPLQIRSKQDRMKDATKWQVYRLKFSQGEKDREEIFCKLEGCNKRLKELLQISEDDVELIGKRAAAQSAGSNALCRFWEQASRVFSALSLAWSCSCRPEHSTRLLLEHRTSISIDLQLLYTKSTKDFEKARRLRITEKGKDVEASDSDATSLSKIGTGNMSTPKPNHRSSIPIRSAMKTRKFFTSGKIRSTPASTSVTITQVNNPSSPISMTVPPAQPITNLCRSLECSNNGCCGFVTEDDTKYFVYEEPAVSVHWNIPRSITLDSLLQDASLPRPTRRQRIALAFILSSSFLQLLESPWLSDSWQKSDVIFFEDPTHPGVFRLDEPHLDNCLERKPHTLPPIESSRRMQLSSSLETLGVVLIELCFGKLLKDQPCRAKYPHTGNRTIERALDIQAAREWHGEIEEEAGHDYSVAVGWCLGGILSTPPDKWREAMHSKVVHSLESCHKYLQ